MLGVLKKGISGNALKIIALITMTIDHVGEMLFPKIAILKILGRIAFPIFAFAIAEGCFYTRNKVKHFLMVFILGVLCQIVYCINYKSLYIGILLIFSVSIALIYLFDKATKSKKVSWWVLLGVCVGLTAFVMNVLPTLLPNSKLFFDYGAPGAILPVFIYAFKGKWQKIIILR